MSQMKTALNIEPIIRAKLNIFREQYSLSKLDNPTLFEYFVNHNVLMPHSPEIFSINTDLLESVSCGTGEDMGIDGIAIKYNSNFVTSKDEIDDFKTSYGRDSVEFFFIQSKYRKKLTTNEFLKFLSGIEDFFKSEIKYPKNEVISDYHKLKEYLYSEDMLYYWENNPKICVYFTTLNLDKSNNHLVAMKSAFVEDMSKTKLFSQISVNFLDSRDIKRQVDENTNIFTVALETIDQMPLGEVNDVQESTIVLCEATEYLKVLTTDDGLIRKNIFTDNVRDFQGETDVNSEILGTIKERPNEFVLLNNGITIVCDKATSSNRKLVLKNPQIVNGCQTSNMLHQASIKKIDLSNTNVSIKVISTKSSEITNRIVRGTNKQNIVLDEVFEITKPFHKELEEYVNSVSSDYEEKFMKIYYERRSKQYEGNAKIKHTQRFNLKVLTQEFVGIFLLKPHQSYRHESKLLEIYKNQIFVENQSYYPYFVVALLRLIVDEAFRERLVESKYRKFKTHLMLIMIVNLEGVPSNINILKEIEEYSARLLKSLHSKKKSFILLQESVVHFDNLVNKFIIQKGERFRNSVKTSEDFTNLILNSSTDEELKLDYSNKVFRGTVLKVTLDKNGYTYGFISRTPGNIFFHSNSNRGLNFSNLLYQDVTYEVQRDSISSKETAINIKVVKK